MVYRKKNNKYPQHRAVEIDLHGLTKDEATTALYEGINTARQGGHRRLRVIVGRGVNSPGGQSVLQPYVRRLLTDMGISFHTARIDEGGEGALIVIL